MSRELSSGNHSVVRLALLVAVLVGCAGAQPGSATERGDAARILCEADCRRELRCGHDNPSCLPRCAGLPVQQPPVWSTSWAREVGSCIDQSTCGAQEACVFATSRRTSASAACFDAVSAEHRFCPVLNGLTDDAAERARRCYETGRDRVDRCRPRFDWK